ncbi:MAG: ribosome silencing factor [Candidatus Shikimatogenerans bostrichidophilus]|nr:MAG: ribosome silencing factor [Candidatus Shikimatogenerans bostrichidophilus]
MKINKKISIFIKNIKESIRLIKGRNIKILDTREKNNNLFNFIIICEGKSKIHIKIIYNKIILSINKHFNISPNNIEGVNNCQWVIIDYNTIIINIFLKKIRYYYEIDKLWKKYPKLKLN